MPIEGDDDKQERGEFLPDAVDLFSKLDFGPGVTVTRAPSARDPREILAKVTTLFDTRPANGFDGFLPAIIAVAPAGPVACPLVASIPSGPYNYNDTLNHTFALSCSVVTFEGTVTAAQAFFEVTAGTAGQLINLYLFRVSDGALVDSLYGADAGTLPNVDVIELGTDDYVGVITGASTDDIDPITVRLRILPF